MIWDWEAPAGAGDTHFAFYKGTRARVEVRQTQADRFPPGALRRSRDRRGEAAGARRGAGEDRGAAAAVYPGVGVEDRGAEIHVTIPDALRVGHEAHFAQVTASFLEVPARPRARCPRGSAPTCWRSIT